MKYLQLLMPMILTLLVFSNCRKTEDNECIIGNEDYEIVYRDEGDYNAVKAIGPFQISIAQMDNTEIKFFGETNVISGISTSVANKILTIGADSTNCYEIHHEIETYLTSPEIIEIILDGPGRLAAFYIVQDELEIVTYGEASVFYSFEVENFEMFSYGTEDLEFSGSSRSAKFNIEGSGSIDASDLVAENCIVESGDSGDLKIHVSTMLDVTISGNGNIYYSGEPEINKNITGTGQLIKVD